MILYDFLISWWEAGVCFYNGHLKAKDELKVFPTSDPWLFACRGPKTDRPDMKKRDCEVGYSLNDAPPHVDIRTTTDY
jgi:hypothetical protein